MHQDIVVRWVVWPAVLFLAGCVGEGHLDAAFVHACRAPPDRELEAGDTYGWVNQTIVDLATQGWGFSSIRLLPCRSVEANFAVVSLPDGSNQNVNGEPFAYILVMVYASDAAPAAPGAATSRAATFLRWATPTPGATLAPATNDWTMLLDAGQEYRLLVATNTNGYRIQVRDMNPAVNSTLAWTTNLTLQYRGPMGRLIQSEPPQTFGSPPYAARSDRAWTSHYRPGNEAFLIVRSWLDATARWGNFSDRLAIHYQRPAGSPDDSYDKDGYLGTALQPGAGRYTEQYADRLAAQAEARLVRSLHLTTSGLHEPEAGLAALLVPLTEAPTALAS